MLTFLGDGGAFDYIRGNTNAFYKSGDELFLIDCGSNAYFEIMKHNLLSGVKHVIILITHLHADHFGGVASLCDYLNVQNIMFNAGIEFDIYYPNYENIETILSLMLIPNVKSHLHSPSELKNCLRVFDAVHFSNAYSYLLEIDGNKLFYSGDTSVLNEEALKLLIDGKIDYFYHEACDKQSPYHIGISQLADKIPQKLRKKVTLMHISGNLDKKIKELGFNLCNVLK
ncbi:MAG: MBL fold metallo-hydrolase [Clostridia bacterium]|nr:MBL fold metallo-hydrolase [Clostridia bacterium]